jgi:hypothetical protein
MTFHIKISRKSIKAGPHQNCFRLLVTNAFQNIAQNRRFRDGSKRFPGNNTSVVESRLLWQKRITLLNGN